MGLKIFSYFFFPITDLDESRLKVAKELGADMTFKITSRNGKEVAQQINKEFGPVDKTIECTGAESSIHTAIYVCFSDIFFIKLGFRNTLNLYSYPSAFNSKQFSFEKLLLFILSKLNNIFC